MDKIGQERASGSNEKSTQSQGLLALNEIGICLFKVELSSGKVIESLGPHEKVLGEGLPSGDVHLLDHMLPAIELDDIEDFRKLFTGELNGMAQVDVRWSMQGQMRILTCIARSVVDETRWIQIYDSSDVKTQEITISERYELLQKIFRKAKIGTWLIDMKTKKAEHLGHVREVFGLGPKVSAEDAFARAFEMVVEEDKEQFLRNYMEALEKGDVRTNDFRVRTADNQIRFLRNTGIPVPTKNDVTASRRIGITQDVTDLRSPELIVDQADYRQLTERISDGIWRWDLINNEITWNDGLFSMLGYAPQSFSLNAFRLLRFVHPDDRPQIRGRIQEHLDSNESIKMDIRLKKRNGDYLWMENVVQAIRNDANEPTLFFGTLVNIDEKKRAEEALKNREADLTSILNSSRDAYVLLDPDLKIRAFNKRAIDYVQMRGVKALESGVSFADYLIAERAEFVLEKVKKSLQGIPQSYEVETDLVGEKDWFDVEINPIKTGKGLIVGACIIVRNITSRKHFEESISGLNRHLEQKVEERTRELEAFNYTISHDLRAPLRAIGGFAEMLARDYPDGLDEHGGNLIRFIGENVDRMSELMEDLLDYSRLVKRELDLVQLPLEDMIKHCYDEAMSVEKGLESSLQFCDPLPIISADKELIRQIFQQLFDNAIKYRRKDHPLQLECGMKKDDQEAVIYIKDNGIGFDQKYSEKIFNVFSRLHGPKEYSGTGMGLAKVRRIVKKHGGNIWASSEKGAGARFFLSFPKS